MNAHPKGARRALQILDFVARARFGPSSAQIFEHLEVPRSSGYDLLSGLTKKHFLNRQPNGRWVLGDEFFGLAMARFGLGKQAAKIDRMLASLQEETQETAQLAVLHGAKILITHSFNSARSIRVVTEVGTRVPLNWSAAGRLLVSELNDRRLRALFPWYARPPVTGRTALSSGVFIREVREAARRGYAIELEQIQSGCGSVAAPIQDAKGRCVAAVNLVLPVGRLLDSRDTLVSLVCACAAKLK